MRVRLLIAVVGGLLVGFGYAGGFQILKARLASNPTPNPSRLLRIDHGQFENLRWEILKDQVTGREWLSYGQHIVEIRPAGQDPVQIDLHMGGRDE